MEIIADIHEQFREAMADAGLVYSGPIRADGRLHRVHVEGDSRGTRNGWFVLHGDGIPAGAFGSWKAGVSGVWRASSRMSWIERAEMRDRIQAAIKASNAERELRGIDAALRAERIWNAAGPAGADHPYLQRKAIKAHGLRQQGDVLIVPVFDLDGAMVSLQRIGVDGEKRFLPGGRVRGGSVPVYAGNECATSPQELVLVEGFATGATIHEITGKSVIVAFNAGNLGPVARGLQGQYPKMKIIIAADNDHATEGNPGLTKARAAARAVGGSVVAPPAEPGVSDWNDWFLRDGVDLIRRVFP